MIKHVKSGIVIAKEAKLADSFFARLKGLMFVDKMDGFDALIIEPCNSIHNCFVRFPIDVIFLNRNNEIVKLIKNFKPWRFSFIYPRAVKVVELPVGMIDSSFQVGDELEVSGV